RPLPAIVRAAVEGGVTLVQVRDKLADTRSLLRQVRELRDTVAGTGVRLVVNDRVDVVLAAGADGVHVGQEDMPAELARRLLGPDAIVGVSCHTPEQAAAVDPEVADYIGAGPVRPTATKQVDRLLSETQWHEIIAASRVPVIAIGGITPENAGPLWRAGFAGLAVVSAICGAADPRAVARALLAHRPNGR
ncbi:MAG TPA: thiamine phosphate synthase, partial [Arenibaculum sp.]|nr:thiamine phosphate synthase [Arenibaculum sp.]